MPWIETTSPKVFTEQPTPPYLIGDTWSTDDGVLICSAPKTLGEEFSADDWSESLGRDGVSVSSVTRYYKLASSKPSKPTANPPGWTATEPSYTQGSDSLYFCDLTTLDDGSWSYSDVSLSSSYEAAKAAYNKAQAAEGKADATANHFFVDAEGSHIASAEGDATTGGNTLTTSSGLYIRKGTDVSASFEGNEIALGLDAETAIISFCGGTGTIKRAENSTLEIEADGINSVARDMGDYTSFSVYPRESLLNSQYNNPIPGINRHSAVLSTRCGMFDTEAKFLVATSAGATAMAGLTLESNEAYARMKLYSNGNEGFLWDWVVSRYTEGMWEVEKWASGRMVIEGQKLVGGQATSPWGNGFITAAFSMGNWPEPFIEAPRVTPLYNASGAGDYQLGNFPSMTGFPTTTACPDIMICTMRNTSPYDAGGYLGARAVGRWK